MEIGISNQHVIVLSLGNRIIEMIQACQRQHDEYFFQQATNANEAYQLFMGSDHSAYAHYVEKRDTQYMIVGGF